MSVRDPINQNIRNEKYKKTLVRRADISLPSEAGCSTQIEVSNEHSSPVHERNFSSNRNESINESSDESRDDFHEIVRKISREKRIIPGSSIHRSRKKVIHKSNYPCMAME